AMPNVSIDAYEPRPAKKSKAAKEAAGIEATQTTVEASTNAVEASGTLTGRFVFDGVPPMPKDLKPPKISTRDGREISPTGKELIEEDRIVDESLLVDRNGGIENVFV